jgi:hypothetical protein
VEEQETASAGLTTKEEDNAAEGNSSSSNNNNSTSTEDYEARLKVAMAVALEEATEQAWQESQEGLTACPNGVIKRERERERLDCASIASDSFERQHCSLLLLGVCFDCERLEVARLCMTSAIDEEVVARVCVV